MSTFFSRTRCANHGFESSFKGIVALGLCVANCVEGFASRPRATAFKLACNTDMASQLVVWPRTRTFVTETCPSSLPGFFCLDDDLPSSAIACLSGVVPNLDRVRQEWHEVIVGQLEVLLLGVQDDVGEHRETPPPINAMLRKLAACEVEAWLLDETLHGAEVGPFVFDGRLGLVVLCLLLLFSSLCITLSQRSARSFDMCLARFLCRFCLW